MTLTIRALTAVFAVDIDDALPDAELAYTLLSGYPRTTDAAVVRYRLEPGLLSRTGMAPRTFDDPADLIPVFELDFYEQVIAHAAPGWLLHAAAISDGERALVFAGPSGAGKTTLMLALIERGFQILTEEITWIGAAGLVLGLNRPMHIRASSDDVPRTWARLAYPMRTAAPRSNLVVALPPPSMTAAGPLELRALVRLTHGSDRTPGLTQMSARDALRRFWDTTLRPDDAGLAVATDIVRLRPAYRLASTTLPEALSCLEELLTSK